MDSSFKTSFGISLKPKQHDPGASCFIIIGKGTPDCHITLDGEVVLELGIDQMDELIAALWDARSETERLYKESL